MKKSVLIIDDDYEIVDYLESILEDKYIVLKEYNGRDGLNTVINKNPDLIILDIKMPVLDGIEFVMDFKTKNIPIPILVASGSEDTYLNTVKLFGYHDIIKKPFIELELVKTIQKIIR